MCRLPLLGGRSWTENYNFYYKINNFFIKNENFGIPLGIARAVNSNTTDACPYSSIVSLRRGWGLLIVAGWRDSIQLPQVHFLLDDPNRWRKPGKLEFSLVDCVRTRTKFGSSHKAPQISAAAVLKGGAKLNRTLFWPNVV